MNGGYGPVPLPENWPDWEVIGELGRGSFSVVYEAARKSDPSVRCAIKKISVPQDEYEYDDLIADGFSMELSRSFFEELVNDFTREIDVMEQFKGVPSIVSIVDYQVVSKEDGIGSYIFIRMELLTSLEKYISDKVLSEEEMIRIGTDICTALVYCHEKDIIHRDIKPANIFVNDHLGTHVFFKLGDFGIARNLEGKTQGLSSKGTPNYMAPEVAAGMKYGADADLYSLGLTLYWLANNKRLPFFPQTRLYSPAAKREALARRLSGEPLPPPVNASDAFSRIILKACSFRSEDRFRSAGEMKAALEGLLRNDPSAVSPMKNDDSGQEKQKKRKIARWIVLTLLVCSAGLGLFSILNHPEPDPVQETATVISTLVAAAETPEPEAATADPDAKATAEAENPWGIDPDILGSESKLLADKLVPVNAVCESAGVRMELLAAVVTDTRCMAVYSLQDLEGNRIHESTGSLLYSDADKSESLYGSTVSFDESEKKIVKLMEMEYPAADLSDRDITFRIGHITDSILTKVDLMPYVREYAKDTEGIDPPEQVSDRPVKILDPARALSVPLHKYVTLTGIGWINGRLHIQFHYPDQVFTDRGGGLSTDPADCDLRDYESLDEKKGNKDRILVSRAGYSPLTWGDENGDGRPEWEEYVFDCDRERIDQVSLYAWITENHGAIRGKWSVDIPLSDILAR